MTNTPCCQLLPLVLLTLLREWKSSFIVYAAELRDGGGFKILLLFVTQSRGRLKPPGAGYLIQ